MSAIFGCVDFGGEKLPENLVAEMETPFLNFKIDEYLKHQDGNVAMGCGLQYIKVWSKNDRLPIVDGENGIVFTADCIIDNRGELIAELCPGEDKIPDGKLLYLALQKWGPDMAKRVYGAYSYALWDENKKQLTLGVDHTACRALYYRRHGNRLYFATRMESILAVTPKKLYEKWMANFFALPALMILENAVDTPFEDVYRMVSSRYNVFTAQGVNETKYFDFEKVAPLKLGSDEEYKQAFRKLYKQCVEEAIDGVSENVGIMISGGFDSSTVAAFAATKLKGEGKNLLGYTHVPVDGYEQRASKQHHIGDETKSVLKICEMYPNIKPSFLKSPESDGFSNIAEIQQVYETPYKTMTNIDWIFSLYKKAGQDNCRMLLTGQCGNFTVSYGRAPEFYLYEMLRRNNFIKAYRLASNYCKAHKFSRKIYFKYHLKEYYSYYFTKASSENLFERCFTSQQKAEEFGVIDTVKHYHEFMTKKPYQHYEFHKMRRTIGGDSTFSHTSEYDTAFSLKNGMVLRDPTRDPRLQAFCSSLPMECFINEIPQTKRLVRSYCSDLIPKEFLPESAPRGLQASDWRERIIDRWDNLYPVVKDTILNGSAMRFLDEEKIANMVEENSQVPEDLYGYSFRDFGMIYGASLFLKKHNF